tara:strand:+ start:968 stop:1237 length:270 start_codon:yes stop_codon:yes gene_type:complete
MAKKKNKVGKKRKKKPSLATQVIRPRRVASTQQILAVHNQALKNTQRDQAEAGRQQLQIKEQLKAEKLQMETAVLQAKYDQLNQYQIAP